MSQDSTDYWTFDSESFDAYSEVPETSVETLKIISSLMKPHTSLKHLSVGDILTVIAAKKLKDGRYKLLSDDGISYIADNSNCEFLKHAVDIGKTNEPDDGIVTAKEDFLYKIKIKKVSKRKVDYYSPCYSNLDLHVLDEDDEFNTIDSVEELETATVEPIVSNINSTKVTTDKKVVIESKKILMMTIESLIYEYEHPTSKTNTNIKNMLDLIKRATGKQEEYSSLNQAEELW
eukprot:TRINITY_DN10838_c0_g1_i1.p1 TRINITY_DN10838_c0_g1~~TRINITY_DN10838_c0_g1_i1.p1  ORF type:complete len:233 (+),score=38.44 TRINITY_DN10838_c0_g1_i1:225-923(+)